MTINIDDLDVYPKVPPSVSTATLRLLADQAIEHDCRDEGQALAAWLRDVAAALQIELQLRPHESPLIALMRGLCLHEIRVHWLHRHDSARYWSRKHVRIVVAIQVEKLRRLGPGPVELPETVGGDVLGAPVDWWGTAAANSGIAPASRTE